MVNRNDKSATDKLSEFAGQQKTTRREFMQYAAALGVATTAASGLWAKKAAAAPSQGGHGVFGFAAAATSDSLDATATPTDHSRVTRMSIRNNLIDLDADGNLVPDLAESWESSSDLTDWVFRLRPGVEFHSGKSLTPEDVIDSVNVHRGEDSKSGGKALLDSIDTLSTDGNGVRFKLKSGNADFPYYLTQYFFTIQPTKDGKSDMASGDGTGPFVLSDFEAGVRSAGERNPNYHKNGQPYFDSVELLAISDPVARTNALNTGQVHAISKVDYKTVELLKKVPGVDVAAVQSGLHYTLPMLSNTAPYDNNDVRLAVKFLVNREDIVNKVLKGYAALGNDHPISPDNPFFNTELPQRDYDAEKAKFHLKKAGLSSLDLELFTAEGLITGAVDIAVLLKESAKAAGINITINRQPSDGFWSNVWNKKPFSMAYWNPRPTADLMFTSAYWSEAKWNDTRFNNERFDKLLLEARTQSDFETRKAMYWEMQELLHNNGGQIIPAYASNLYGISDKIGHGKIAGALWWDNARMTERWWMKS